MVERLLVVGVTFFKSGIAQTDVFLDCVVWFWCADCCFVDDYLFFSLLYFQRNWALYFERRNTTILCYIMLYIYLYLYLYSIRKCFTKKLLMALCLIQKWKHHSNVICLVLIILRSHQTCILVRYMGGATPLLFILFPGSSRWNCTVDTIQQYWDCYWFLGIQILQIHYTLLLISS